ncbi:MAG: hypothetical protein HYX38_10040 [Rhodospirillales bacterium]|nr:hypothetical protein [Rhodospirillales bacterium]
MRLGLFLTTLIGLAGAAHIASAADASWLAVPESTPGYCAMSSASWQVDIKGHTLTFTNRSKNYSLTVDLKSLQPDGSGKVVGKDDKNREFYVTFDPGSGARPFYLTGSDHPCRYVFTPKT